MKQLTERNRLVTSYSATALTAVVLLLYVRYNTTHPNAPSYALAVIGILGIAISAVTALYCVVTGPWHQRALAALAIVLDGWLALIIFFGAFPSV